MSYINHNPNPEGDGLILDQCERATELFDGYNAGIDCYTPVVSLGITSVVNTLFEVAGCANHMPRNHGL